MKYDFFFWWSVISTVISIILLCISIWQYLSSRYQEEKNKAQIKVWMQDANGLSVSLNRIVIDNVQKRYSSTNDVCNAVWAIQATAFSLYQSLYEERCVSEKEYKERQKKISDKLEADQLGSNVAALPKKASKNY